MYTCNLSKKFVSEVVLEIINEICSIQSDNFNWSLWLFYSFTFLFLDQSQFKEMFFIYEYLHPTILIFTMNTSYSSVNLTQHKKQPSIGFVTFLVSITIGRKLENLVLFLYFCITLHMIILWWCFLSPVKKE